MGLKKMQATAKVFDRKGNLMGFMRDKVYYSERYIRKHPTLLLNVKVAGKGIEVTEKLPVISIDALNEQKLRSLNNKAPFERDIQKDMREWRVRNQNNRRHGLACTALNLRGMRRTGKTTEAKRFGYANYACVVYTDMSDEIIRSKILQGVVEENSEKRAEGLRDFCDECLTPYRNSPSTLWIIDEVQDCLELYAKLPEILDDLKCDILVVNNYITEPTTEPASYWGTAFMQRVSRLELFPMSFKEFCRVYDVDDMFDNLMVGNKVRWRVHTLLNDMYNVYQKIGGFPIVVKTWMATNDFNSCAREIKLILEEFIVDAHSYFDIEGNFPDYEPSYMEHGRFTEYDFHKEVYMALLDLRGIKDGGIGSYDTAVYNYILQSDDGFNAVPEEVHVHAALNWFVKVGFIKKCDVLTPARGMKDDIKYYFCDVGILNYLAYGYYSDDVTRRRCVADNFMFNELQYLRRNKGFVYIEGIWYRKMYGEFSGIVVDVLGDIRYNFAIKTLSTLSNPVWYYACRESRFSPKRFEKKRRSMPLYAIGNIFPNLK